jgi:hypothetical protein
MNRRLLRSQSHSTRAPVSSSTARHPVASNRPDCGGWRRPATFPSHEPAGTSWQPGPRQSMRRRAVVLPPVRPGGACSSVPAASTSKLKPSMAVGTALMSKTRSASPMGRPASDVASSAVWSPEISSARVKYRPPPASARAVSSRTAPSSAATGFRVCTAHPPTEDELLRGRRWRPSAPRIELRRRARLSESHDRRRGPLQVVVGRSPMERRKLRCSRSENGEPAASCKCRVHGQQTV